MAGHSHWANIAAKKGIADKKRGKLFGKLSRAIIVAAQSGGADTDLNLALRYAIDKARKASMPKDNIDRAIQKGCGETSDAIFVDLVYEGYGPGGVAVMCDALTENRNRTASEVRKIFEVHGGNLGNTGCVGWMFDRKGLFMIPGNHVDEDRLYEIAIDAGADDVQVSVDAFEVTCAPENYQRIADALQAERIPTDLAEISRVPSNHVDLDAGMGKRVLKLIQALEEQDDLQSVTANFNISDQVMEEVSSSL